MNLISDEMDRFGGALETGLAAGEEAGQCQSWSMHPLVSPLPSDRATEVTHQTPNPVQSITLPEAESDEAAGCLVACPKPT